MTWRIYAQLHRGRVDSWRDENGNEVDGVLTARDKKWAALEVKLPCASPRQERRRWHPRRDMKAS